MQLTGRDTEIINFIELNKGATIEQIQKLWFTNYTTCSIRLKLLADNKFLKVDIHPVLGKKVYFTKKMPSFHALVLTDFVIQYKDQIKFMQREYKIKNHTVDCIIILNNGEVLVIEIDIFNKTKKDKINDVMAALKQSGQAGKIFLVSLRERKEKIKGINYILYK